MMRQVDVCIPTIGESEHLGPLVKVLLADPLVSQVDLYINEVESEQEVLDHLGPIGKDDVWRVHTYEAPPETIYWSWNESILSARAAGTRLAILNDDITFPEPYPVTRACEMWDSVSSRDLAGRIAILGFDHTGLLHNQTVARCRGSYRHGGIPGFAFMLDPEMVQVVDPRFQFWYGDDDLFFTTEQAGFRLARCAVPVAHHTSTTALKRDWVPDAIDRDTAKWKEKWGDR